MNKVLYIDMDDVLCDFSGSHAIHKSTCPEQPYPQSKENFFLNLAPIEGAVDSVSKLIELYDVYILTAPSTRNPLCYTEKRLWVENHLGYEMVKRLIISPNKSLLKGDYLVDDYTEGKGQESFEGGLIHFGSSNFPSWKSVLNYLSADN